MFKINCKETRKTSTRRSGGIFVIEFETISSFFSVSSWLWTDKCLVGLNFLKNSLDNINDEIHFSSYIFPS